MSDSTMDFGVVYIISQFFAALAIVLSLISMQQKKKTQILNINTLSAVSAMLHYLFLGAWTGVATKIISTTRNAVATYEAYNNKTSKILPFVFIGFYVVCGVLTYESVFSLLPIISTCIFTLAVYLGNEKTIRYIAGIGSALWLVYNVHIFSVVGAISEMIFIISDLIAIWRFRKRGNEKKE